MATRIVGCALLSISCFFLLSSAQGQERFRVGFIGSLSGPAAAYGNAARNGVQMALKELPEGRRPDFLFEDDEFVPLKTLSAFRKLEAQGVDVVITIGSSTSKPVAPVAKSLGVPLIAWASDQAVSRGNEFVIRSYPSGFAEGAAAGREAYRRGLDRIAVFASFNDYVLSWTEGLRATLGKSIVSYDEVPKELQDFRSLILRASGQEPMHAIFCLAPGQNGLFAHQLKQLLPILTISGCEYLSDSSEGALAHGSLRGAWYPTINVLPAFIEKYGAAYGNTAVISAAANHYDLTKFLAELPAGTTRAQVVPRLLGAGPREGAAGTFAIREEGGDRFFDIPLKIREVE